MTPFGRVCEIVDTLLPAAHDLIPAGSEVVKIRSLHVLGRPQFRQLGKFRLDQELRAVIGGSYEWVIRAANCGHQRTPYPRSSAVTCAH